MVMKNGYYKDEVVGTQEWYLNDKLHREDGPAVIWASGTQYWFLNGKRHREDGPAIIWADGTQSWYLHDTYITDEVNKWFDDYNLTYDTLTDEEKWYLIFYIRGLV
jgi:hypothetical protein